MTVEPTPVDTDELRRISELQMINPVSRGTIFAAAAEIDRLRATPEPAALSESLGIDENDAEYLRAYIAAQWRHSPTLAARIRRLSGDIRRKFAEIKPAVDAGGICLDLPESADPRSQE
jgi:hypothetical protein